MVKGTTSLELNSATSADTRVYECKVQDSEDEEGKSVWQGQSRSPG